MKDKYIPFYRTPITAKQIKAVVGTLKSGWLTTGPAVHMFEEKVSEYLGAKYAIGVSSCTAGLHLALLAAGVGPGDEVITTPYTFIASIEAIVHCGAIPVFADIDPETFNLSASEAEKKITRKTKAIMPVHIAGLPCDIPAFERLSRKYKIRLVHDAAHAIGSAHRGRKIGAIPDITSFSFYATKNITTGEGGMVTTSSKEWAESIRILSLHGMDRHAWKRYRKSGNWYYEVTKLGYKYNLADLNARLGLAQFDEFEKMQRMRIRAAHWYDDALADIEEVILPPRDAESDHAWHLYIIRISCQKLSIGRDQVIERLTELGVGTSVHFIPVFMHPYYRKQYKLKSRDYPRSADVYKSVITLPLFPGIRKSEVAEVARRLKIVLAGAKRR
ncbi:MAG: DegT/DnrJ/EryC1/StrS aminotransferase family protein [Candidatus Zixiibacteriota bacterium]